MKKLNKNKALFQGLSEDAFPIIEQITTGMPGGFFVYRADGDLELIYANHALFRIYGREDLEDFQQFTGFTFKGLVHPDDWERVAASIDRQIAGNLENLDHVEYRVLRKNGDIRWIEDYGYFVHTERFGSCQ